MFTRLLLVLLAFSLIVGVASADPPSGRSSGKGRSAGRGRNTHSNDSRKSSNLFTSALQHLSKSLGKRPPNGPVPPKVMPIAPVANPETPPSTKPEATAVVNPAQVPNPLADLKPVIASPAEDEDQEEDETPSPLSSGAIAAIIGGIAFGMLLLVGLTVMIVHHRRGTPRYRRPRRRDEIDQAPTDV